jgi:D-glycero-alpha-D-manno-heptose-7-phosphate kinase
MLCTTRTPLRVSLFGGGTDYPDYFEKAPGAVVGFSINRYIYISALVLTAWQAYDYRVAYSTLEHTQRVEDIQHPIVREVLRHYGVAERLDINILSDLPASGGLGSSSAFTVGFVNLISNMFERPLTKMELARKAMFVEQELLAENVGVQDQLHTAMGGVNRFDFESRRRFRMTPLHLDLPTLQRLNSCMVLVHTGTPRRASEIAREQIGAIKAGRSDVELARLYDMVSVAVELLEGGGDVVAELGEMLKESWAVKRTLSAQVTNLQIDDLYERCMGAGAYGGKLCGAGGGGFVLMLVEPERRSPLCL